MMIPYFVVLVILAAYGIYRYVLVYNFYHYRHNIPGPPPPVVEWPKVTIQLPIYNERYVIERLVDCVAQFDYPHEKLDIQLLDDSTDETQEVARACVERHQQLGVPITYIHRENREGYKAGALQEGLKSATGEFVAIFDADFLPPGGFPDPHRSHISPIPSSAMVQTRWSYINRNYSALTEAEAILLDGHFVIEHGARYRRGSFFNFNGTGGVWRRTAIEDSRGMAARHADGRHRSLLSRAASRLAFPLFARRGLSVGAAGGDERVQIATGALGKRPDADSDQNSAARLAIR